MLFVLDNIIANYADDITPYTSESSVEHVIGISEEISNKLFHWFALTNESK